MALVTGNLARIGWKKMERAGLKDYFRFGAFAGMAPTRAALARLAIRRAHAEGWIARDARIALIGDAPSDILAAKANRARAVAVPHRHLGAGGTGRPPARSAAGRLSDLRLDMLLDS